MVALVVGGLETAATGFALKDSEPEPNENMCARVCEACTYVASARVCARRVRARARVRMCACGRISVCICVRVCVCVCVGVWVRRKIRVHSEQLLLLAALE